MNGFSRKMVVILLCLFIEISETTGAAPRVDFLSDSRYLGEEHEDKMRVLVSSCKFPKSFRGAKQQKKIVIKRSLSRSHCVRRHEYKADSIQLDLSGFTNLLRVEPIEHEVVPEHLRQAYKNGELVAEAEVEAMTSMETLVDALLPLGLVPAIVPEFKGITIGGSLQGLAAESSSFKYGFVHDCITGFEALLADGKRLWCSPTENRELFEAIPGSFGSLGICTRAIVLCMRATPYVEVSLRRHTSHQAAVDYMAMIQDNALGGSDTNGAVSFLEGIGFSEGFFATIEGRFVAEPSKGTPKRHCNGFGDKWFYNQVQEALADVDPNDGGDVRTLHFDTKSYLFRHDRGSFWMASYRIPQIVAQYVLGSLLDSSNMFLLATLLPWVFPKHQIVLQDFMLPRNTVNSFFDRMQETTPLYPVWLLPMRNIPTAGSLFTAPRPFDIAASTDALYGPGPVGSDGSSISDSDSSARRKRSIHMMNIGAYGIPKGTYAFEEANRALEMHLTRHGGRKVFYSHAFYNDKTFYDELYDGERYFKLREKYGAEGALPEIFEKVVTKSGRL